MELTSYTSKIYLHTEHSHWKQTEDGQKDSCTTRAIRKIHTELGRKGREVIRSGHAPLGGDTEEEGDYTVLEILPRKQVARATYWMSQAWVPTQGRQIPVAGLKTNGTNRRAVRNLDSAREEHTHICSLPTQGRGSRLKLPGTLAVLPWPPQHVHQPELSTHSSPYCSIAQLNTSLRAAAKGSHCWHYRGSKSGEVQGTDWG